MKIYILLALSGVLFLSYQQDQKIKLLEKQNLELKSEATEQCGYIALVKELRK